MWAETEKALLEPNPRLYFETLRQCKALVALFPDVDALFGVPQPAKHHPEIDTGLHTLMVLDQSVITSQPFKKQEQLAIRFAALTHDLGKGKKRRKTFYRLTMAMKISVSFNKRIVQALQGTEVTQHVLLHWYPVITRSAILPLS